MEPEQGEQDSQPTEQPTPQPAAEPPAVQATGFEGDPAELHANVPDRWPGAFGVMPFSKAAVKLNFWTLAAFWVLAIVVSGALKRAGAIGQIVGILVGVFATAGYVLAFLAGVRGERLDFADAFKKALPYTLKLLVLELLVGLTLAVSFVLLVIPFFFVLPRLSLASYFLIDKNMGILDAYKASWHATKGNAGKVWGIYGVTILFAILILVLVGIYLVIVYSAAIAVLYEFLNRNPAAQPVKAPAPAPAELA
jgi:hypothetical protein